MDIKTEIDKRQGILTGGREGTGHPVDDTALSGKHFTGESIPITTKHVECFDCHNPHAVKQPTNTSGGATGPGDGNGARVAGMKYVDIKGVVHDPATGERQPYIYEICLKCHGGTFEDVFSDRDRFPITTLDRSDGYSSNNLNYTPTTYDYHFSSKRREFDPEYHQYANYPATDLGYNTSYHPVASPGRNGTQALCYQLMTAFNISDCSTATAARNVLSNLTIQCTDCHNSEQTGATTWTPIVERVGPVTESNLRTTDRGSKYTGNKPVGPHGSSRRRLLRGHYVTTNTNSGDYNSRPYWSYRTDSDVNRPKFELCFLCHQENCLISGCSNCSTTPCGSTSGTNFGNGGGANDWGGNLHLYHLSTGAVCHDCHHNVHSNVEAQNTIFGNGFGAQLPPDSHDNITDGKIDTHLINFGPQASGSTATKPRWYYDENGYFRCSLRCHGYTMSLCYYTHGAAGTSNSWCAGPA
jgi:hypothetical protein